MKISRRGVDSDGAYKHELMSDRVLVPCHYVPRLVAMVPTY
jgi:hypothetical protein